MSHFSVAVISKKPEDVDSLLEPFWEDLDKNSGACEFILDKNGDYDEEEKANGYWVNPIARWDWYEIGGSATYESREKYTDFLKQCIGDLPDLWITIVDCHI